MKITIQGFLLVLILFVGIFSSFSVAQLPPDTAKPDPKLLEMYRGMFDKPWCEKFVELWNKNPDTAKFLGGMGQVNFVSVGEETTTVLMYFDSLGKAKALKIFQNLPIDSIPTFTASLSKWADFMEGKFGAIAGVVSGKIRYKGPMTLAFKYGFYFGKVAPVGKQVSEFLKRNRKGKQ